MATENEILLEMFKKILKNSEFSEFGYVSLEKTYLILDGEIDVSEQEHKAIEHIIKGEADNGTNKI